MSDSQRWLMVMVFVGVLALVAAFIVFLVSDSERATPGIDDSMKTGRAKDESPLLVEPAEAEESSGAEEREALIPVLDQESVKAEKAAQELAAEGLGAITGRILNEFGQPVHDAEVQSGLDPMSAVYSLFEDKDPGGISVKEATCQSGKDGRFHLPVEESSPALRLKVSHPDHVIHFHTVKNFTGGVEDVGDITLTLGGSVSGFVRDARGRGIASAEITYRSQARSGDSGPFFSFTLGMGESDRNAVTGPDGFYRITGLSPGETALRATHPEFVAQTRTDVKVVKGREQGQVDFTLPDGHIIAGRVVDAEDRPVEGAGVNIEHNLHIDLDDIKEIVPSLPGMNRGAKTDEDGLFRLTGLAEGSYVVTASAPAYLRYRSEKVKTGTENLLVVLEKAGWVAGRVKSAGPGEAVTEFDLEIKNDQWTRSNIKVWKGEEAVRLKPDLGAPEGAFFIQGLEEGPFKLLVTADGFGDHVESGLSALAGQGQMLEIGLWPESVISGRLITIDDEPVARGDVYLKKAAKKTPGMRGMGGVMRREVRLERSGGGMFLGTGDDLTNKRVESDEDGYFIFKGVAEGEYEIVGAHDDHTDTLPLPVSVARGERVENLALKLGLSGSIEGTVFSVEGEAKPGARVQAKMKGSQDFLGTMTTSEADGTYRFKGLQPGEYQVKLMETGGGSGMGGIMSITIGSTESEIPGARQVAVKEGEISQVDLYEIAKGMVSGRVTEAGAAVPDIAVKLFREGPMMFMPLKTAKTDERGEYTLKDIMPGDYVLRAGLSGLSDNLEEKLSLAEGEIMNQDFDLPTGRVEGRLTDQNTRDPVPDVRVRLERVKLTDKGESDEPEEQEQRTIIARFATVESTGAGDGAMQTITLDGGSNPTVKSNEDGRFEIRHVRDGHYKIVTEGGGYARMDSQPIEVKEGKKTDAGKLELRKGYIVTGKVVDVSTGEAIPFCPVMITPLDPDGNPTDERDVELSEGDGSFRLEELNPGSYRLQVDTDQWGGSADLNIMDEDLADYSINVSPK
ncbi:MAG: carboxypeptidase regulatory-like domain-containing protein [Planctomycetota bacterium]|jgi:protocatechuate 3,4-dioxygenase beta subunit